MRAGHRVGVEADAVLPPVRVGISHGPVLPGYADYFGRTVNLASRLCTAAGPGEILLHVDPDMAARTDWSASGVAVAGSAVSGLKGIDGEVRILTVTPAG